MSINLVSLVSQYLTPELIGRIAGALGVDRTLVGKAATYLAPVLLRMLAGVAATPAGARRLAETIEHQDPSILENLESAIGGTGLVKEGVTALESLLGGSGVSALGGVLSKFTGLGEGAASSLIGTLTPAVLGTLGKVQATQGLDASGLSQLLQSQKENISAALPSELGDLLSKAGVPGFTAAAPAAEPERPASRQAERPAVVRATPPEEAPSSFNWRLILPAVAALGLLAWWLVGNRPEVVQTKTSVDQVRNLTVDGVDLKSSAQTAFDGLKTALLGVKDTATAQAALPQLEKGSIEFDKLRDLAGKLPIDAKTAFATLVASLRPSIEELFNKVLAIPGVAPIAKPIIDGLRAKIDTLAKAESKA